MAFGIYMDMTPIKVFALLFANSMRVVAPDHPEIPAVDLYHDEDGSRAYRDWLGQLLGECGLKCADRVQYCVVEGEPLKRTPYAVILMFGSVVPSHFDENNPPPFPIYIKFKDRDARQARNEMELAIQECSEALENKAVPNKTMEPTR
jgi:hypothetical protein